MSSRRRASLAPATPPANVRAQGRVFDSVLDLIGATPLVRLPRLVAAERLSADLALKLEFLNPLGSVKDRVGLAMIEAAERNGQISPGRTTIVEATSGNTGLGLALAAAAKGYALTVVMPDGSAPNRAKMLRLLGAKVDTTPARQGMAGAIGRAESLAARTRGAWMARVFDNAANPDIHAASTAEEIWRDTAGEVGVVVGGVGTGGTLTGIGRALKPRRPSLRIVGVEPAESAVLSGDEPGPHQLQGIGAGFRPSVLDLGQLDEVRAVSEAEAITAVRRCAALDGLAIGLSSGAVLHAMIDVARAPAGQGRLIVGVAASSAERYLSTALFDGL